MVERTIVLVEAFAVAQFVEFKVKQLTMAAASLAAFLPGDNDSDAAIPPLVSRLDGLLREAADDGFYHTG